MENRQPGAQWCKRMLCLLVLTGLGMLGVVWPAYAHDELLGSVPANGAKLESAPSQIELRFSAEVKPSFATVTVVGADGRRWEAGPARVIGTRVVAPAQTAVPAGTYTVGYRVVSSDGHPVTGQIRYQVTADATAVTTPTTVPGATAPPSANVPPDAAVAAPRPVSDGGSPVWPWIVGAVVLVGLVVIVVLRSGRTR